MLCKQNFGVKLWSTVKSVSSCRIYIFEPYGIAFDCNNASSHSVKLLSLVNLQHSV